MSTAAGFKFVGKSRLRWEGPAKLSGKAEYVADLKLPGSLSARLVLSPHARARIRKIVTAQAERLPGVAAVFTDADLAGLGGRGFLAGEEVFYVGQPVAVVVAVDEATAEDAADLVQVEYEAMPAVVDPLAAMRDDAPLVRPDRVQPVGEDAAAHGAATSTARAGESKPKNVNSIAHYRRGNLDRGWALADVVVSNTFRVAGVHPGYMETQGLVVEPRSDGGVNVWASTQGAFTLQRHLASALGLPEHLIRVTPMTIGGGFGGKIILHQALIAQIARILKRPIRLIYDRMQDMLSSKPAPGAIIKVRMGATKEGRLVALESELILDSGAAPGAPVGIAAMVLASTYRFEHLDVKGYEVLTHKAPVGAYRAPGAPQAFFALESQVDEIARRLNMDPIELRLRNASRQGDPMADGKPWPRIGLVECLERVRSHPFWTERKKDAGEGYGVAAGGWLGGMEPAVAACRLQSDGSFSLHIGAVDLTGTDTTLGMIAAEVLGVEPDRINIVRGNTDHAPFAGLSAGSKVTYTVGAAVRQAAEEARRQLLAVAAEHMEVSVDDLEIIDNAIAVRGAPAKSVPIAEIARLTTAYGSRYAPVHGFGRSAIHQRSPGFAVHVAKVHVDQDTGRIRPVAYLAVQDVGKALNPAEVRGQIHGGVAQGIGRALLERMAYDDHGQLVAASFMDYLIPTAQDVPPIQVELVEVPSPDGPFGAKGVGEPPVVPVMAAVANAVVDAVGVRITQAPMTPAVFWEKAGSD